MSLGDQIRAYIGPDVLDRMLDDLVDGLVAMARAQAEHATRAHTSPPHGLDYSAPQSDECISDRSPEGA
jgi:hypothetical protein